MVELLLLCQAVIAGCYCFHAYRRSGRDIFQHIYWLLAGYLGVFLIPLWLGREWIREQHAPSTVLLVYAVPVVGLVCIILGYEYAIKRFTKMALRSAESDVSAVAMARYGAVLCALGTLGELWVIRMAGGAAVYYSASRTTGAPEGTTAYIYDLRWLWTVGLAIMIGALIKSRLPIYFLTAAFFWILAFGYNVAVGQRSGVWVYSLLGLALFQVWQGKRAPVILVAGVGLAAVALMGFVGLTRGDYYLGSTFDSVQTLLTKPPAELAKDVLLVSVQDEDASQRSDGGYIPSQDLRLYADFLRIFPTVVNYDFGVFYAQYLVGWIPKAVWPERPDFRLQKKEEVLFELGTCHICSPSPTILGMYWMHGGVLAVCFLCVFTGAFFGFFDAFGRAGGFRAPVATAVYLSVIGMAGKAPITLGPLADFPFWAPFVALPLLGLALFRSRGPRRSRGRVGWAGRHFR